MRWSISNLISLNLEVELMTRISRCALNMVNVFIFQFAIAAYPLCCLAEFRSIDGSGNNLAHQEWARPKLTLRD